MFFRLILENANGDRVDMTTTANQYMTSRVEGLNPPTGTISTSSYAGMDGSYLNNAFIEKRNVVIHFEMRGIGVEKRRHQLYKVVKPSRYVKVYYKTAGIDVFTEGYVETCEVNNFEMLTTGQISILCPDIYWYSTESVMAYYSQITGAFTFPFPTESNPEPFVLGKFNTQNIMEIINAGDEIGFTLQIEALADVRSPTLYNADTDEYDKDDEQVRGAVGVRRHGQLRHESGDRTGKAQAHENPLFHGGFGGKDMKFTLYTADCTGNAKISIYPNQKVITSEADLRKAVTFDHVCALYANNARSDVNFQLSDVVPMDCDNDHSDDPDEWITPEKLSEMLSDVEYAITYSRHHMLSKGSVSARPRFHVFFPTTPCKDAASHKSIKSRIYKELSFFDGNALDASRFLFGSKGDVVWHEGSLTIEDWLLLMKTNRSIPQGQRNSTMSRMAGKLVKRFGVTEEAHAKFLEKAAECDPPLDDEELEGIWASACKFGKKVTSQEGYVPPDQYGDNVLIPDDFSDVGEARTFVECFGDEIAFTIATNFLRYNGTYWEESEQAAVMAMI